MEAHGWMLVSLGAFFLAALAFDAIGRRTLLPRVTLLILSRWKRANAHWSPKPYRDTVLAWSRKKGNSYSSDAQRVSGVRIQLSPTPALNWH